MLRIMEENKYEAFENRPYPYGSEYAYDNTAEEGVFVAAMLAQEYGFESDPYMSPEERIKALMIRLEPAAAYSRCGTITPIQSLFAMRTGGTSSIVWLLRRCLWTTGCVCRITA